MRAEIIAESYLGPDSQGRVRPQVRPAKKQVFPPSLNIECSKKLINDYPIGTKFKLRVKLTNMKDTPFLYSYFGWHVEVIK